MASSQHTAKPSELDRLLGVFRENPKSTVFISLAQGYLNVGRAAEAIDVLNQGLGNYPDHTEARLLLGRAFAVLHRWKEAEAELVKVVKLDRYNQAGFALLGEILVRRGNYDVASKALQRAIDLDPTDDKSQRVLERARIRRPLDPPPPIPGETQPLVGKTTPSPFTVSSASLAPPLAMGSSMPGAHSGTPDSPLGAISGELDDGLGDNDEHDEGPTVVNLSPLQDEQRAGDESADTMAAGFDGGVVVASSDVLESAPVVQMVHAEPAPSPGPRRRPPRTEAEEPRTEAEIIASVSVPAPPRSRALATEPVASVLAEPPPTRQLEPVRPRPTPEPAPSGKSKTRAQRPTPIQTIETPHLNLPDVVEPEPAATAATVAAPMLRAHDAVVPVETEAPPPRRHHTHGRSQSSARRHSRELEARKRTAEHLIEAAAHSPEAYLNHVLGGDRVVHPERDITVDDGLPIERWGHKVKHPFLWLWGALGVAVLSTATWYLLEIHARDVAVRKHLAAARTAFLEMTAASLAKAEDEATMAIARNPASIEAVATMANARAFALLVYGDGQNADVETAIAAAKQRIKAKGEEEGGQKELSLARAAYTLAAINRGVEASNEIKQVRTELDQALLSWPDEPLLYWLNGLTRLAVGDRAGAREALKQAQSQGLLMARVVLSDMDLDEGNPGAALSGYDEVLKKAPAISLASAGRALARADANLDPEGTLKELEPQLTHVDGKRGEGWARLALSTLASHTGDPDRARTELDGSVATGLGEPRFLARVALAQIDEGRIDDAFTTRTRVRAKSADPLLPTIDAELLLAGGRPDEALKAIGDADDARGKLIRGRALLEGGRAADAVLQLTDAVTKSGGAATDRAWLELAKLTAT